MKLSVLLFAAAGACSASAWAQPQASGETMANTCAACHGTHGRVGEDVAMVPLAGMDKGEFIRAMRDFRSGKRPSTLMHHVASGFTDAEVEAMAEFFAAQSLKGGER